MASGKRQPSKQKRTNQNRQQRAARQARTTNASSGSAGSSGSGGSDSRRSGSGSLLGRLRGGGTTGPAGPRSEGARSEGAKPEGPVGRLARSPLADRSQQPVGYRAALTGLLAAIAAVVVFGFQSVTVDAGGDPYTPVKAIADWGRTALDGAAAAPEATGVEIAEGIEDWLPGSSTKATYPAYFPMSLMAALPLIAAALAFQAVRQRRGAKVVTRAMYAALLGTLLFPMDGLVLPAAISIAVAGFQVRKAEVAAARQAAEAQAAAEGTGDHDADVIEAQVVEEDVVEVDVIEAEVVETEVVDEPVGTDEPAADERA